MMKGLLGWRCIGYNSPMSTEVQPIFISGRFRSGTSFLWQLFDRLPGFCAWYEPLHPQLLSSIQHTRPKTDHVGIQDYWTAYRQHPGFESHYEMAFATSQLYLEAGDDYPELKAYIDHLIQLSAPEVPVLQFNRVDFRLPWLKRHYPQAKIIQIKRNPLQLYHSQRKHIDAAVRHQADYWDAYELVPWCHALAGQFPFLLNSQNSHAFERFYSLYQLSNMLGSQCADVVINLDEHVFQSDAFIEKIAAVVGLGQQQQVLLKELSQVPELPEFGTDVGDEFAEMMTAVELLLTDAGLSEYFGLKPLTTIKQMFPDFWSRQPTASGLTSPQLLQVINQINSEMTRILSENQQLKARIETLRTQLNDLQSDTEAPHE